MSISQSLARIMAEKQLACIWCEESMSASQYVLLCTSRGHRPQQFHVTFTHTCASVAKQYNYVPVKGQQSRVLIAMRLGGTSPPPNIWASPLFDKSSQPVFVCWYHSTLFHQNIFYFNVDKDASASGGLRLCPSDPVLGFCPWTPLGDFRPPDSLLCRICGIRESALYKCT